MSKSKLHILMFPWFAMGHITSYLYLSNKLAERGHKISFLLPNKAKLIVQNLNLHPSLINIHSITIPHVDGLPPGAETVYDIPFHLTSLLATAMDQTRPQVEQIIVQMKPHFVFYDLAYWIPLITSNLGVKSVCYNIVTAALLASRSYRHELYDHGPGPLTVEELAVPPPGYPSTTVVLRKHESHLTTFLTKEFGSGITFYERVKMSLKLADAIAIRTCREVEGHFCDFLSSQLETPVLVTGPVLPDIITTEAVLDQRWASWLGKFGEGSVVFCAFGSEFIPEKKQFQEILLGLELTGLPFFVAMKAPTGCSTIEEALPDGFEERVKGKGVVHGGWVQQPLILNHPSVGCFVGHGGSGSMWESLMSSTQIVLIPLRFDHIFNTRLMAGELKVALEVEKEENDWVSREILCRFIKEAMDKESKVGSLTRENHAKLRDQLMGHGFMSGYVNSFVHKLEMLLV